MSLWTQTPEQQAEEDRRYRQTRLRQAWIGVLLLAIPLVLAAVGLCIGEPIGLVNELSSLPSLWSQGRLGRWIQSFAIFVALLPVCLVLWLPGVAAVDVLRKTRGTDLNIERLDAAEEAAVRLWRRLLFVPLGILAWMAVFMGLAVGVAVVLDSLSVG